MIFIFGGSQGLGLALAKGYHQTGRKVIIAGRQPSNLATAAKAIGLDSSATRALDVTQPDQWEPVLDSLPKDTHLTLINCAGFAVARMTADTSSQDAQNMIHLNLLSNWSLARWVCRQPRDRRIHLVFVGSMASYIGLPGYSAYCASKFGLRGLAESLHQEFRSLAAGRWQVSLVYPPNMQTPGFERENIGKPPRLLAIEEKAKTHDPQSLVPAIIKSISRADLHIFPTLEAHLAWYLSRWMPWLLRRFTQL